MFPVLDPDRDGTPEHLQLLLFTRLFPVKQAKRVPHHLALRGVSTGRDLLLDEGSPFLEMGALAAMGLYDGDAPSAGIVTGVGRVWGREVMVVANVSGVKNQE